MIDTTLNEQFDSMIAEYERIVGERPYAMLIPVDIFKRITNWTGLGFAPSYTHWAVPFYVDKYAPTPTLVSEQGFNLAKQFAEQNR